MDMRNRMEDNLENGYQMRMRQTGILIKKIFRESYPPGYEYKKEGAASIFLLGIGIIWNFRFFEVLYMAVGTLYTYEMRNGVSAKVLRKGVNAKAFTQVAEGYWGYFVPLLLFLVIMAVYHYFYYCRESKSIYLMRRLPKRGVLFMSCVQGPLLWAGMSAVAAVVLYLLYYGIYLLVIPSECTPRFM